VKPAPFAYHAPSTVDEAVDLLAALGDGAKVLAGGQSLIPLLNMRLAGPDHLVDISRIDDLARIGIGDGRVRFGAAVTHERLRRHEAAASAQPLLARALGWVAHPVIRNRGTSVGSIVHADPAAELPAVLAVLDGTLTVRSRRGSRTIAADAIVRGPLESDVAPDEVAVEASVGVAGAATGSAFLELARRHGDYALAGVCIVADLADDGTIASARASFIGVGTGTRVLDLAETLAGQHPGALDVRGVVDRTVAFVDPESDIHADAGYRRHLAGVLAGRAAASAVADARVRREGGHRAADAVAFAGGRER
jgi:CO/xanthine dehydrogenase FAD-binding subunit